MIRRTPKSSSRCSSTFEDDVGIEASDVGRQILQPALEHLHAWELQSADLGCHRRIGLDGDHLIRERRQAAREVADSRPDLEHAPPQPQPQLGQDPFPIAAGVGQ